MHHWTLICLVSESEKTAALVFLALRCFVNQGKVLLLVLAGKRKTPERPEPIV